MTARLIFGLLLAAVAHAQLTLVTFDGTNRSPVGATFNYGSVAVGDNKDVVFQLVNNGNSAVIVKAPAVSGAGFTITAVNGSTPYTIPPVQSSLNFLAFTVRFSAGPPAAYSANLQINSISVILLATSVPSPSMAASPPCAPSAAGGIDFGSLQNGVLHLCNVSVSNPNAQALTISTLRVTGDFQADSLPLTPLTLAPGANLTFAVQITPACGRSPALSGALAVNTRVYPLTGSAFDPSLPKPSLTFNPSALTSMQQPALAISLPTPAACPAAGYVSLAFTPATNVVPQDKSIMFLAGSVTTLPFSVQANTTQISINGQPSAAFQTGTTAGTITFTLSQAKINGDPTTTVTIPPSTITIATATASNQRTGELDLEIVGFDNTYSAGAMSFTFFDAAGNTIASPISADFTSQFRTYFSAQQSGSAFLMRVSFPLQGDRTKVAKVQATLTNSAGRAQTGSLTFQ